MERERRKEGGEVSRGEMDREREQERERGGQYVREGGNGKVSREGEGGGGGGRKGRETNSKQNCFFPINIDGRTK